MRIISGALGGRRLGDIPASGVRPAMGKTREALFSMLEARGIVWTECAILDLYAGGGSLAFEALSRGAKSACMVDKAKDAIACMELNAENLGLRGVCRIVGMDVKKFLRAPNHDRFDLVFIDPPYGKNLAPAALERLIQGGWLNAGAFVAAEIEKGAPLPNEPAPLADRLFGQTCVKIWKIE